MAIPAEIQQLTDAFFASEAKKYDMAHADECGKYIEAMVPYCQSHGYPKVGFLKKTGSGTQYNGHSIDGFLYREPDAATGLLQHVDCIGNAEQPHPWKSEGGTNDDPRATFGIDIPRYKDSDWLATPSSGGGTVPTMVPWVGYDEHFFNNRIQQQLAYDYGRRPQNADFAVSVWSARVFHSAYMGPEGIPLGFDAALRKHRPEWCGALGVPVDDQWF